MKKTLLGLLLAFSLLGACSDDDGGSDGAAGSGGSAAGSNSGGSAGSGTAGSSTAGTAGSGQAGSGTAGSGTAGSGDAGSGGAAAGAGGDAGAAGSGAGSDKVAGCNADNAEDMTAGDAMVMREGFAYKPACLKIKKGKSVMFMANNSTHPLKGMDKIGTQPNPLQGPFTADETVTYPEAGIFGFYCTAHGSQLPDKDAAGMAGAVVVVE